MTLDFRSIEFQIVADDLGDLGLLLQVGDVSLRDTVGNNDLNNLLFVDKRHLLLECGY